MIGVIIALLAGIVIGLVLSRLIFRPKHMGTINVDCSDDEPYLFLELDAPLNMSILSKKQVTFAVRLKNYIPQD